jgi:hypothetical protein
VLRRKPLLAFSSVILASAGAVALAGCPGTATTTTYTPITGLVIQSSALVAGYGCGTGPGQVYRYAAILYYVDDDSGARHGSAFTSGVFDCYADAIFSNLPADDAGSTRFSIDVLAYDQAAFPAALACGDGATEAGTPLPCPGDDPGTVLSVQGTPTWTTTCKATQESGVPTLADCEPLASAVAPLDAGEAATAAGLPITIDTTGFVLGDGGTLDCAAGFTAAQASFTAGSQSGQTAVTSCPTPLVVSPTVAGATYAITVHLFQGAAAVATASCTAQASASQGVTASCQSALLSGSTADP